MKTFNELPNYETPLKIKKNVLGVIDAIFTLKFNREDWNFFPYYNIEIYTNGEQINIPKDSSRMYWNGDGKCEFCMEIATKSANQFIDEISKEFNDIKDLNEFKKIWKRVCLKYNFHE